MREREREESVKKRPWRPPRLLLLQAHRVTASSVARLISLGSRAGSSSAAAAPAARKGGKRGEGERERERVNLESFIVFRSDVFLSLSLSFSLSFFLSLSLYRGPPPLLSSYPKCDRATCRPASASREEGGVSQWARRRTFCFRCCSALLFAQHRLGGGELGGKRGRGRRRKGEKVRREGEREQEKRDGSDIKPKKKQ